MKTHTRAALKIVLIAVILAGMSAVSSTAQEAVALKGVHYVKTIFDFRDKSPKSAVIHLQLVNDTFKDQALRAISPKPEFVVVFMGPSLLLLTKNREEFSVEEQKQLEGFDRILVAMAREGIRLEVCTFAAKVLGIDPGSFAPEIKRVENGWIASLGYQQQGYSLIPVY